MPDLSLVVPMAGRGSRFARDGIVEPKPLIDLAGHPFFWWATESVRRFTAVGEMVFVVLEEHIGEFGIDAIVKRYYPDARIVALPEVTSGAAETAARGIAALTSDGPVAVNDCDHAFAARHLPSLVERLANGTTGALVGFRAEAPIYSYVRLSDPADPGSRVIGTVEKQVVSPFAIAGCYFFASPAVFTDHYDAYRRHCSYDELFMSGLFNEITATGGDVLFQELERHLSFGTPDEYGRALRAPLDQLWS